MVRELTHDQLKIVLKEHVKKRVSAMIWGATGIGKSQTIGQVSKELAEETGREYVEWNRLKDSQRDMVFENPKDYYVFMDVRISQLDPSDLRGLPDIKGACTKWKAPDWLKAMEHDDAMGVIFFDEINLAPPSVQAAAYQLVLDRALGDVSLSDGVGLISAGNRVEDKANVFDMPLPLQNRFTHATLAVPSIDPSNTNVGWTNWALQHGVDSRIITYLSMNPTRIFKVPKKQSDDRAFPTPRSWEVSSKLIKGIPSKKMGMLKTFMSMSVGEAEATQFVEFTKLQETIDFNDLLLHPKKIKSIDEIGKQYGLVNLVTEWYNQNHKIKDTETLFNMVNFMQKEFGILTLRIIKDSHKSTLKQHILKLPNGKKIATDYLKYI